NENIEEHDMHSEYYILNKESAKVLNETKENNKQIISVGTTSTRVLESNINEAGYFEAKSGWTDKFINPPYTFKAIDGLINNINKKSAIVLKETKKNNKQNISVGTTSTRVLESNINEAGYYEAKSGWTNIFIYPPYTFKAIDGLITNFHLPKSTLLMLISAFVDRETILSTYKEAVNEKYRFFSFGDAMFIISE